MFLVRLYDGSRNVAVMVSKYNAPTASNPMPRKYVQLRPYAEDGHPARRPMPVETGSSVDADAKVG